MRAAGFGGSDNSEIGITRGADEQPAVARASTAASSRLTAAPGTGRCPASGYEQVTRNVSRMCRFFGISQTLFYRWRDRYRQAELPGLQDGPRGPRFHPFTTPPQIVALILQMLMI